MKSAGKKNPIKKAIAKKKVKKRAKTREKMNVSRETLPKSTKNDFLDLDKLPANVLRGIIQNAKKLKKQNSNLLSGKFLAQI